MSQHSNQKEESHLEVKSNKTKESETSECEVTKDLERKENARNALQASLGEFLVFELREAISDAAKKIIQNDQKIEELEDKIRNYEDHIDCLEQLVKELQALLRSAFETQDQLPTAIPSIDTTAKDSRNKIDLASPPLYEVSLDDPPQEKQILPIKAGNHSKLFDISVSFLSKDVKGSTTSTRRKIQPPVSKEALRVDIEEGTLNDFV